METTYRENEKPMSCKLTSPELIKRKATVLSVIKKMIVLKNELDNGFRYEFENTGDNIELLINFIKTERQCCDFFNFCILFRNDNYLVLDITGQEGVKEFIKMELQL